MPTPGQPALDFGEASGTQDDFEFIAFRGDEDWYRQIKHITVNGISDGATPTMFSVRINGGIGTVPLALRVPIPEGETYKFSFIRPLDLPVGYELSIYCYQSAGAKIGAVIDGTFISQSSTDGTQDFGPEPGQPFLASSVLSTFANPSTTLVEASTGLTQVKYIFVSPDNFQNVINLTIRDPDGNDHAIANELQLAPSDSEWWTFAPPVDLPAGYSLSASIVAGSTGRVGIVVNGRFISEEQ